MAVGSRSNLEIFDKKRANVRLINDNSGAFVTPVFYSDKNKTFESYFVDEIDDQKKIRGIIITAIRQASYLGGLTPQSLVNSLRAEVGQAPLEDNAKEEQAVQQKPTWANDANITEINATKLLDEDKNPLSYTNKAFKKIATNGVILIRSDFIPSPLVDEMRAKGATVVVVETDNGWYETYIQKIK